MSDSNEEIEREALKKQQGKSELEQTVSQGIRGELELKKEEKRRFLGEYRERVLIALTFEQVEELGTYPQVLNAIKDDEAVKLILDRNVDMDAAREYIKLAREYDLSFKKADSPEFKGKVALVVVSDHAVNKEEIFVESREEYLKKKGIPEELIKAKNEKLCKDCYQLIKEKAPEEINNYQRLSWVDKLFGRKCPGLH